MNLILIDYSKLKQIPLHSTQHTRVWCKKNQLNYLRKKLIIALFGKVVLESTYNLEMNEWK